MQEMSLSPVRDERQPEAVPMPEYIEQYSRKRIREEIS